MTVQSPIRLGISFLALSLVLMTGVSTGFSQQGKVELAAYGGYQFWGTVDGFLRDGTPVEANIEEAANWGGSVGYRVEETIRFEISYLNQSTKITGTPLGTGITSDLFDVVIQYVQAGAMYEVPTEGKKLAPYGGLSIGAVNFNPDELGHSSVWLLAFGLNGGLKVYLGDSFGFRAQGSLLVPIQWTSGGVFCGGSGCAVGISGGTAILQGAVTGGVFVEI